MYRAKLPISNRKTLKSRPEQQPLVFGERKSSPNIAMKVQPLFCCRGRWTSARPQACTLLIGPALVLMSLPMALWVVSAVCACKKSISCYHLKRTLMRPARLTTTKRQAPRTTMWIPQQKTRPHRMMAVAAPTMRRMRRRTLARLLTPTAQTIRVRIIQRLLATLLPQKIRQALKQRRNPASTAPSWRPPNQMGIPSKQRFPAFPI